MLKIKNGVDLKELEKFGFIKYKAKAVDKKTGKTTLEDMYFYRAMLESKRIGILIVDNKTREVFQLEYSNPDVFEQLVDEVTVKLITANLVEMRGD